MNPPKIIRTVEIRRGKGRYSCPIGKVVLDIADPGCLNWYKMREWGLYAQVILGENPYEYHTN